MAKVKKRKDPVAPKEKTLGTKQFREMNAQIRAVEGDGNERTFMISFSSEDPYERWFGPEILSHDDGAVDLTRLNEIGVTLFNHNRDYVLGKIKRAWIEDGRGCAEIIFDSDDDAEKIYQKVASGTLKGVSVGYIVNRYEEVSAGEVSKDGRFQGPCTIATQWMPFEISIVSVPADATVGVGRDLLETEETEPMKEKSATTLSLYEKIIEYNRNLFS
jgi:phage head maturation protease